MTEPSQEVKVVRPAGARPCALGAGGVALLTLLSWGWGNWSLVALGRHYVPMAPSTAWLLLWLSGAVVWRCHQPARAASRWFAGLAAGGAGIISLLVWIQFLRGTELPLEQWLVGAAAKGGDIPVGRMSPLTATAFLLLALAMALEVPPFARRRAARQTAAMATLASFFLAALVVLSYAAGAPLLYESQTVPMALLTAVAFLLLSLSILLSAGADTWPRSLFARRRRQALADRFTHVLRQANDVILLANSSWNIVEANERAAEAYGYSPAELQQLRLTDLRSPEAQAEFLRDWEQVQSQSSALFETTHRRKDGHTFPVEISVRGVNIAGQSYWLGVVRDITKRKRAEAEILRLNEQVRERTAQLEAANQELESFSYSVSHDLRAPLRSIDGFSLALLEDCGEQVNERGQHYLQRVRTATQRMGQLIDDLLELSRVTRGEMLRRRVNLGALAARVARELQDTQPERRVEWIIAPELWVEGDERLLETAVRNLLGNAWKFTARHGTARIEFGSLPQDGRQVYFVRDDGAGFDPAYTGKLFGAFQRLHSTEQFEGAGVGLAIVRRIMRRHGGEVWAEAAVEQGATFYFTLMGKEA